MRHVTILVALTALALAAAQVAAPASLDVPPGAIAVVAGEPSPQADFDNLMNRARSSYAAQKRPFPQPGTSEYRQLKDQAVALLVQRTEFRQQAAQLGIVVSDAEVDARIQQIIKEYFGGSHAKFEAQLKKQGLTDADVRDEIRAQLISERIYEKVSAGITVSAADVSAYYAKHKAQYTQPASRLVQHILVRSKPLAEQLYRRILAGESFDALAKKYSLDPGSRAKGGRLTIFKGQTIAAFDRVAFSLKTGAVSRPVKTQFGWHVIKALSPIKPGHTAPLARVAGAIREQLLQTRKNAAMTKWVQQMKAYYADKIEYAPGYAPGE